MSALDFGWTAYDPDAPTELRDNGDPLGLRVWGTRVARRLVPIFTPQQQTLWGFAAVCGGRRLAGEAQSSVLTMDDAWLAFEAAWVHSQTRYRATDLSMVSWPGLRRAEQDVARSRVEIGQGHRLLLHPMTQGTWGRYRRAAVTLRLLGPRLGGRMTTPVSAHLRETGQMLGDHLYKLVGSRTWAKLVRGVREGEIDDDVLSALPAAGHPADPRLARLMSEFVGDSADLAALRAAFDEDPLLFLLPRTLPQASLTPELQDARSSANAVLDLIEGLEAPYRRWLVGEDEAAPDSATWKHPAWSVATSADGEGEVGELRRMGSATPGSWEGVQAWQQELARRRGSLAFLRNEVPERFAERRSPTFGLPQLGGLFAEGLLGAPMKGWRSEHLQSDAEDE